MTIGVTVGAAALMVFVAARSCSSTTQTAKNSAASSRADAGSAGTLGVSSVRRSPGTDPNGRPITTSTHISTALFSKWGDGEHDLGRDQPGEGSPSGPMSFSVDARGRVWVLDQVNGRIVRFDDGKVDATIPMDRPRAQDIAVGDDGSVAVLDRFGEEDVAIYGPDGALLGSLPLAGEGIESPGAVTGVFVDGSDVYVERERGPLIRIGDTSGVPTPSRSEIPGRPSRDGKSYLKAGITDAAAGRTYVVSNDRPSEEHRFTREIRFDTAVWSIVLLDTDLGGTIYFAVEVEDADEHSVVLTCLDPLTGIPQGTATLPANTMPEESFRDLVVLDEGGVLAALRSDSGVSYQVYDCE